MVGLKVKMFEPLSDELFSRFRELIYRETGIAMKENKRILLANRLRKRVLELGLDSYDDYYRYLTSNPKGRSEIINFIDAISTNETYFFRGNNHFEALADVVLPELFKKRKLIKAWSAGCSTGEEPYTMSIVALEAKKKHSWNGKFEIIATDISNEVLNRAINGVYTGRTMRFLPEEIKQRYFEHIGDDKYRVCEMLKRNVSFIRHNLLKDPPPYDGFDFIFCRNVMIYFDRETQKKIVEDVFANAIKPDGYLFIGHSESLIGKTEKFKYAHIMKAPIYRPAIGDQLSIHTREG